MQLRLTFIFYQFGLLLNLSLFQDNVNLFIDNASSHESIEEYFYLQKKNKTTFKCLFFSFLVIQIQMLCVYIYWYNISLVSLNNGCFFRHVQTVQEFTDVLVFDGC